MTLEQEIIDLWKSKGLKVVEIKVKPITVEDIKALSQTYTKGMSWEVIAIEKE